jgi:hypothetical protein
MSWRSALCWGLTAYGFLSLAGHVSGVRVLTAAGQILVAAPLPVVFTDRGGFEDFALEYTVEGRMVEGREFRTKITRENMAQLHGPISRRGVYMTAFSLRPNLPDRVADSIFKYGFCGTNILPEALGVPGQTDNAAIHVTTRTRGEFKYWRYGIDCP